VGVEVVQDHPDLLGVGEMHIDQVAHDLGKVRFGALVGDFGVPPACTGLEQHEQVAGAVALVLIVVAGFASGLSRGGRAGVGVQHARTFVHTPPVALS